MGSLSSWLSLLVSLAVGAAGCVSDPTISCGDLRCPSEQVCVAGGCVRPDQVAVCSGVAEGTECMSASVAHGVCRDGACRDAICGDHFVVPPERCDDGNTFGGDGCSATCDSEEVCGNGVVDYLLGEQCDDGAIGATLSGDGCTSGCRAEIDTWLTPTVADPSRSGHAMAYDVARARTVVFGGSTLTTTLNDTWEWDGQNWGRRPSVVSPSARVAAVMAYDRARARVVLFGGLTATGALGDTWIWDGVNWERMTGLAPTPRYGHVMAWDDVGGRVLLFGGTDGTTNLRDTWSWDGTAWTELAPSSAPSARAGAVMADRAQQRIVLFGGTDDTGAQGDTWLWNGASATWTVSPGSGPPPGSGLMADSSAGLVLRTSTFGVNDTWRWNGTWQAIGTNGPQGFETPGGIAFDEARGVVVVFEAAETFQINPLVGETWVWDGATWAQRPNHVSPPWRAGPALATDYGRGRAIMFGGSDFLSSLGDTWVYEDGLWRQRIVAPKPSGRGDASMAYDAVRDEVVLFGGYTWCYFCGSGTWGDTWVWDGATWTRRMPATSPPDRSGHFMAYDAARREVVLFGGKNDNPATAYDETWTWDGTIWALKQVAQSPPQTTSRAMAYDPIRERIVLLESTSTWEWDGASWTQLTPSSQPPDLIAPIMVYHPLRQRITVAGQAPSSGDVFQTWEWDGTAWSQRAPVVSPLPLTRAGAAYDPATRQIVMFGGDNGIVRALGDTWTYAFTSAVPADRCVIGSDLDGDGLTGCADPDCWSRCTPACPPGTSCDPAAPHCGDGTCSPVEDHQLCADCP